MSSSFLRLPLEVREKIYSYLLRGQLIHLQYKDDSASPDDVATTFKDIDGDQPWLHVVCGRDYLDKTPDTEVHTFTEPAIERPHLLCGELLDHRTCN